MGIRGKELSYVVPLGMRSKPFPASSISSAAAGDNRPRFCFFLVLSLSFFVSYLSLSLSLSMSLYMSLYPPNSS